MMCFKDVDSYHAGVDAKARSPQGPPAKQRTGGLALNLSGLAVLIRSRIERRSNNGRRNACRCA
jgi:hypothetical protein